MLALLGDRPRFSEAVNWLGKNLQFGKVHLLHLGHILHATLLTWGIKGYSNWLVWNGSLLVDWFSEEIPLVVQNKTVSVFETTIRVLGGLLSAHLVASDASTVLGFHTFGQLTMWTVQIEFTLFLWLYSHTPHIQQHSRELNAAHQL